MQIRISIFLCLLASACAPVGGALQEVGANAHQEGVRFDHRVRNWFDTRDMSGEPDKKPEPTHAYCYKTLGDITCYKKPVSGAQERLAGKQEPVPMFADDDFPQTQYKPPIPPTPAERFAIEEAKRAKERAEAQALVGYTEKVEPPVSVDMEEIPNGKTGETPVPVAPQSTYPRDLKPLVQP